MPLTIDLKKMEKHLHPVEFEKFKAFHGAYTSLDPGSGSYLANLEAAMKLGKEFLDSLPYTIGGVKPLILKEMGMMYYDLENSYVRALPPGEEKSRTEIRKSSIKEILNSLYDINLQD